ncbi:MAG: DUF3516 domain-containing protein, partial [Oleiharenicola lentus]
PASFDITRDLAAFQRLVRTAVLGFLQDVAARDWEGAVERFAPTVTGLATVAGVACPEPGRRADPGSSNLAESRRIEKEFAAYFDARGRFRLDPEGRAVKHTHISGDGGQTTEDRGKVWQIAQVLADPEELNDWEARFSVSLDRSRAENRPVIEFLAVRPVGELTG